MSGGSTEGGFGLSFPVVGPRFVRASELGVNIDRKGVSKVAMGVCSERHIMYSYLHRIGAVSKRIFGAMVRECVNSGGGSTTGLVVCTSGLNIRGGTEEIIKV